MKVLIVDDTRLARQELKTLLKPHTDIVEIREANSVDSALAALAENFPDLLLLDIQMPGGSGFDLLEQLDQTPAVVFTTAYDHYAVKAFDANALDYLVKPIDPQRLTQALTRVRQRLQNQHTAPEPTPARLTAKSQVFIRDGDQCWFVALEDIDLIEAAGNYVQVSFRQQRAILNRSLNALEERLAPTLFYRANRSCLVNLQRIKNIEPWVNEGYLLTLRDGQQVEVSRRQARQLRSQLSL
ncbi:LytTR family DNA-binding domain-containing protein [Marinimicrobium sp. ABcell2]|uniref:LytR/AlgR family response regulator transcription factor n=1 Tax=Marinimicrobium sp. ABcell2 TaxID=3069751 RepID=UPI0027AE163E|nr:response regulator [Marinimicrobium sp. ABcell2]MDQ2077650.1 LytTR family transcriptional regulator DNA-binding domain-containing protein [Marinimicrobium sp. ABcell2]